MSDLATWLRAQLDEDEQWARAASRPYEYADEGSKAPEGGAHWQWVVGENWEPVTPDPVVNEFVAEPGYGCNLLTVEEWPVTLKLTNDRTTTRMQRRPLAESIVEMDSSAAGHIVRHDPARVLAEVDGKRRILDWLDAAEDWMLDKAYGGQPDGDDVRKLLALPYADRPGYREEWAPPNG